MCIGLHVNYPIFLSDYNGTKNFLEKFAKKILKFHENPSSGSQAVPRGRTDGRTDRHVANSSFFAILRKLLKTRGPGSGLDDCGIESRWWRDFPHLSRPVLGPTQPPVQWVSGISRGKKAARAWRWPLTPFQYRGQERVELYLHSPYTEPQWLYKGALFSLPKNVKRTPVAERPYKTQTS